MRRSATDVGDPTALTIEGVGRCSRTADARYFTRLGCADVKNGVNDSRCTVRPSDAIGKARTFAPMSDEKPFYSPDREPRPPRQPQPGEQVWRLRNGDHVQACELRNDERAGAGWDVMVLEDGEPLFSRRCANEHGARFVAESFRQDLIRTGWTAGETA